MTKKAVILGASGFVGFRTATLLSSRGWEIVSLSRRGAPSPEDVSARNLSEDVVKSVKWTCGDASLPGVVDDLFEKEGPFDCVIHAVGTLFDASSGLGNYNTLVSAANSIPTGSYDDVTKKTAYNLLDATERNCKRGVPFVFVSAAEAGWPEMTGGRTIEWLMPSFLKRYLIAKRAVETRLLENEHVRACIVRPSLVWNWKKYDILVPVLLFSTFSKLGVPFVKHPITVDDLCKAIQLCVENETYEVESETKRVSGLFNYEEMMNLIESDKSNLNMK